MSELLFYAEYSRADVHRIFAPDTNFTSQAGTWGLQGVVPIPDRVGDYVFFVTFGQTQSGHAFEEGITEEGVLTWQSQPRQALDDPRVLQWTSHNEFVNNIYLFLRTSDSRNYAYLGRLKYLDHDRQRERPVYFQWQILDWSITTDRQIELGLELQKIAIDAIEPPKQDQPGNSPSEIIEVAPPEKAQITGTTTPQFKAKKGPDYSIKDALDRKLGLAGELAVVAKERQRLKSIGRTDLADKVMHVSLIEGDGAGYDIKSFDDDGEIRYLEVKTTRGGISTPFFMSINEIRFSESHAKNYVLYRVFEFKLDTKVGRMFKIEGSIKAVLQFEPINYRVRV